MKTTLLIPTLNEIDGVRKIMPQIKREWVDQIIVLDGGSTDGTIEFFRKNGYFVHVQKKRGLRKGYMEIYDLIEGDILITFAPDGNCIPDLIPKLIAKIKEGYDMVIVSRYKDNAKSYDDDLVTAFGNWMFRNVINILFKASYTDPMGIFRAYKKSMIKTLDLDKDISHLPERWFGTNIAYEVVQTVRAVKRKLKIAEIPGDEPPRIGGERKLEIIRWGCAYLTQIIRELFYWK